MIEGAPSARSRPRRVALMVGLLLLASGAFGATAIIVSSQPTPQLHVNAAPGGSGGSGTGPLGSGALVPAADLVSDPVFVNSSVGFALETTQDGNLAIERLARSNDGGKTWRVTGSPFPVDWGFSTLQFISPQQGYIFGNSGLLDTSNGGRSWRQVTGLDGTLERAIPIGSNVWATYTTCPSPGVPGPCSVGVAISLDDGNHWEDVPPPGITEASDGGDVLARWSLNAAYVLSYGATGGGLVYTANDGHTWRRLADPCSGPFLEEDLAAPPAAAGEASALWLICGAITRPGEEGQPKLVYRSYDGAKHWTLVSSTGFTSAGATPLGQIPLSGWVSQLATINSTQAWLGIRDVGVIVSWDSGATWVPVQGIPDSEPNSEVGVTFNNSELGWAIVFRQGVWRTGDAVRWQLMDGH
ncbi:MAG: hypothetical protein WAL04_01730 [Acidimicrobiales bacterium]